ncbi:MAG: uncharacterized protein JWQ43_986 [Glaciihabitans sp.]|nr:uncharacterized protein [Glaciihabitans sp.]
MGTLLYGAGTTIDFDDRTLAHLQLVIGAKMRRSEAFFFSWKEDSTSGSGRGSLWLDSSIPLFFNFRSSAPARINRGWIEALTLSANSPQGLFLTEEPDPDPNAGDVSPGNRQGQALTPNRPPAHRSAAALLSNARR